MEAEFKRVVPRTLGRFDAKPKRIDEQNLRYPFDPGLAWAALHYLRTPSRIYWDIAELTADRLEPLYEEVVDIVTGAPDGWLAKGLRMTVEVRTIGEFPASPLQVRGTVKNGIVEGARARGIHLVVDSEEADLAFHVHARDGHLVLSIDLAGRSQHRRGYRLETTEAPLKENLAAQMLILSRWDPRTEALLDPMMGAGTLPVEAALMAAGAPIWKSEEPPAHRLPIFEAWADRPHPDLFPGTPPPMFGSDVDPRALQIATDNARRAEVQDQCFFLDSDMLDLSIPKLERVYRKQGHRAPNLSRGLVICNPPYGERLSDPDEVEVLYEQLVEWGVSLGPGWRFCFLAGHTGLELKIRRQPRLKKPMSNGPIKAYLLVYDRLE